jgi:hypothetical protein
MICIIEAMFAGVQACHPVVTDRREWAEDGDGGPVMRTSPAWDIDRVERLPLKHRRVVT